MEACFARPSFYSGIIVENPTRIVPITEEISRTWFLAHLDQISINKKYLPPLFSIGLEKLRVRVFVSRKAGRFARQEAQKRLAHFHLLQSHTL